MHILGYRLRQKHKSHIDGVILENIKTFTLSKEKLSSLLSQPV